ncbi:MAG: ribosomal protein [Planctomycetota bacterium]|jgi:large subunit ribosomal protein L3
MSVGLIGKKIGMTQVYDPDGVIVPVTVIEAGPCVVTQIRTRSRDGYDAVQLGFGEIARGKASRARRGHVASLNGRRQVGRSAESAVPKAECEPPRWIREFRTADDSHGLSVGQKLAPSFLADVKYVDVIGVSLGRGFSGAMRRHNFHGQPASHGAKRVHRKPGSVGASADPSRVLPGTRMAGHYGAERVTSRNLVVVRTDDENNVLLVRGAIPGPNGGFVIIRRSAKKAKS